MEFSKNKQFRGPLACDDVAFLGLHRPYYRLVEGGHKYEGSDAHEEVLSSTPVEELP